MPSTFTYTISSLLPAQAGLSAEAQSGATAIRDLALDPVTLDLMLENGDLVFNVGVEAVASDIGSRLRTFGPGTTDDGEVLEGEWFLDTSIGVDYWGRVFRGSVNEAAAREAFAVEAAKTPGVLEVRNLVSDLNERELSLSFNALTDLGAIITATLVEGA